jgi:hypothetical protein
MGSWFLFAGDGEDPVAGDPDQPAVESDLAETTQVVDAWVAAWEADDADAVAALFTEDGVYSEPNGSYEGRDAIRRDALSSSRHAGNHQRTAELSSTGTGSFIFPFEFDFQGDTWIGEAEIELDGDLISRLEILSREIEG